MSKIQSSSHYAKLIKQRYDRLPIQHPSLGKQEYEDLEFVRSFMHENGQMSAISNPASTRRLRDKFVSPKSNSQTNLGDISRKNQQ